ncbi:MAG TPA: response regulator, partial [Thermodesulfobacteriota bacterium]
MQILVVDDNQAYAEILRAMLARSGYDVRLAASGAAALDAVRRTRPALVIMDLYMAEGDGDEACRALKADPETGTLPVIMMSAGGRKDEAERCVEAGCDEFLVKPIRQTELLLAVSRHLHGGIRNVRVDVRVPVSLESGGTRWAATSVNVSLGGIFIEMPRLFQPGTEMLLEFALPGSPPVPMLVRGKVAWLNRPDAKIKRDLPVGMGVEFTKMAPEAQNALGLFLGAASG